MNSKYECLQGISFSLTLDSLAVALLMLGVHIGVAVLIVAVHVITISVRGLIWIMNLLITSFIKKDYSKVLHGDHAPHGRGRACGRQGQACGRQGPGRGREPAHGRRGQGRDRERARDKLGVMYMLDQWETFKFTGKRI